MNVPAVFASVTFDWGTLTLKDLVYGLIFLGALVLGHRKVWAWYYQLDDCRTLYEKQLSDQRATFTMQLEQLRADFKLQLTASEERANAWKELVLDGRTLVRQSVSATMEMAKRHGA